MRFANEGQTSFTLSLPTDFFFFFGASTHINREDLHRFSQLPKVFPTRAKRFWWILLLYFGLFKITSIINPITQPSNRKSVKTSSIIMYSVGILLLSLALGEFSTDDLESCDLNNIQLIVMSVMIFNLDLLLFRLKSGTSACSAHLLSLSPRSTRFRGRSIRGANLHEIENVNI